MSSLGLRSTVAYGNQGRDTVASVDQERCSIMEGIAVERDVTLEEEAP